MSKFMQRAKSFLKSEDGPTAVEYAVLLALIVVFCVVAIGLIGTKANTAFTNAAAALP